MSELRPHNILDLPDDHFDGGRNTTAESEESSDRSLPNILRAAAERPPILTVTADYTLVPDDEGKIIEVNAGVTTSITIPAGLPVGFFVQVRQVGAGTARIVAGAGVTINVVASAASPIDLAEQWGVAAIELRAANTAHVSGQLA